MKRTRHACGYVLWSCVLGAVNGNVVVNYRDGASGEEGILVWLCPGCSQPLQLWWDDPSGQVVEAWEQRQAVDGRVIW
jgi:hypothetical protein